MQKSKPDSARKLQRIRNTALPALSLGLLVLLIVGVILAPAETRLGNVVKLVYVHGALVWTGLFCFSAAGLLGLIALGMHYLFGSVERSRTWYRGTEAAGLASLGVWIIYVISSMAVTGLTWGQLIAWNEPRVRATAFILMAAIVVFVVSKLVNHCDFTAAANILMAIVPWVMVRQAGVIRHPVDPIGGSGSVAIQGFYWLIVFTVAGLAATWIAWIWAGAELRDNPRAGG